MDLKGPLIGLAMLALQAQAAAQEKSAPPRSYSPDSLKIYISADMEGVVGVVSDAQLYPEGFEYERFRGFMTAEVNACIEAAREAGATEILVSDSHGNGQNLLIERLPDDVMVVRSWPRPLGMMEGIDESFDGVILLGYHASTANEQGVLAHTFTGSVTAFRLNGASMSEASVSAAIAGHFGVPVIMVSGDNVAVAETQALIGDVEGAVVKWTKSFRSAQTLTPEAAYLVIRERTRAAIERIDEFEPYVLETPVRVELSLTHSRPVELLSSYLLNVDRVNSHTFGFEGGDIIEATKFLEVALGYSVDMQP